MNRDIVPWVAVVLIVILWLAADATKPGRYAVATLHYGEARGTLLLDTRTGDTRMLSTGKDGYEWKPVIRRANSL